MEKIKEIYCCDCKEELICDDEIEEDMVGSIRCPECWAKMEKETSLEND